MKRAGRRPGQPRTLTCGGCTGKFLTMAGWPFRCDDCGPAAEKLKTGPILKAERYAIRGRAHSIVAAAIRAGEMKPAHGQSCADCGCDATDYDHRDYTKPLQVDAVCRRCNLRRGPALVWTINGRLPIDGRVSRHLPANVFAAVVAQLVASEAVGA